MPFLEKDNIHDKAIGFAPLHAGQVVILQQNFCYTLARSDFIRYERAILRSTVLQADKQVGLTLPNYMMLRG